MARQRARNRVAAARAGRPRRRRQQGRVKRRLVTTWKVRRLVRAEAGTRWKRLSRLVRTGS